jgi:tetratricopeptide (TPR) repeat protein
LDSLNAEAFHLYAATVYSADCPAVCLDDARLAVPLFRRALALDPTLRNTWRHMAAVERDAGRLAEAETHLDTALSFGPWAPASGDRSWVRYLRGNMPGATTDLEAARGSIQYRPFIAVLVRLAAGDSAPARALLDTLRAVRKPERGDLALRATIAVSLGLRDEALDALEAIRAASATGIQARCSATVLCTPSIATWQLIQDPVFTPLRGDRRFQRLWDDNRPRVPWP